MLDFSEIKLPKLEDKTKGPKYGRLKGDILGLVLEQRISTFDSEASPDGPWEELSSKTKRSNEDNHKILQDKGILRASFTERGDSNSEQSIDGDEVSLQSNVEYAAKQNFGSEDGSHPARRFDLFSDEDLAEIDILIQDYLNE